MPSAPVSYARYAVICLARFYQKTISFDHGVFRFFYPSGFCRFHPSCSEYAVRAVTKYGIMRGGALSVWRILRCNPWSRGGVDDIT